MTQEQLAAIHASSPTGPAAFPPGLAVTRVTYVINGTCFAWLAEVRHRRETNFLAGAGVLPEDAAYDDALEAVTQGISARLQVS